MVNLYIFLIVLPLIIAKVIRPDDPVTHQGPIIDVHTLTPPYDNHLATWLQGGSCVISNKFIRLTPNSQSRKGFMVNYYPIESRDFEVKIEMSIGSVNSHGGDGFGIWILDMKYSPMEFSDNDYISGPIFGMRSDFKGVGILFDTYDNDNNFDNPSIFTVVNMEDQPFRYNHDTDFANDMYTKRAPGFSAGEHKCMANYRYASKTKKTTTILLRYQKSMLYVYIDTDGATTGTPQWQICLGVSVDLDPQRLYHLAITAMTGQLADQHDVYSIVTRYLTSKDLPISDKELQHAQEPSHSFSNRFSWLFWILIILSQSGLTLLILYEINIFISLRSSHANSFILCQQLNSLVIPHWGTHAIICLFFFLGGHWVAFFLNSIILFSRIIRFSRKTHLIDPTNLEYNTEKWAIFSINLFHSYVIRKSFALLNYIICIIYYFFKLT